MFGVSFSKLKIGGSVIHLLFFSLLIFGLWSMYSQFNQSLNAALKPEFQTVFNRLAPLEMAIDAGESDQVNPVLKELTQNGFIRSIEITNKNGDYFSANENADNAYEQNNKLILGGENKGSITIGFNESTLEKSYASPSSFWLWFGIIVFGYVVAVILSVGTYNSSNSKIELVVGRLKRFLRENRKHSNQLRTFAKDILDGASEQSTSSQEIVSTMSEMRAMIRLTSEKIEEGKSTANDIRKSSEVGKGIMHDMHNGMEEINRAAIQLDEINEVIAEIKGQTEIINEIVSKTQLLSFNASIEAARAGQYGKGFAVVAQEVSKLAEMSGMASKDISGLLSKSSEKVTSIVREVEQRVKDGTEISTRSMEMFEEISNNIGRLVENVDNFTEANKEQEKGIAEVSVALDTLKEAIDKQQSRTNEVETISKRSNQQSTAIYRLIADFNNTVQKPKENKAASFLSEGEPRQKNAPQLPDNVSSLSSAKEKLLSKNKGVEGAEITGDDEDIYKDFK